MAFRHLGDAGVKTVEKHYRLALDRIGNGEGADAIRTMITEVEKTASLLRGLAVAESLHSELRAITSLTS